MAVTKPIYLPSALDDVASLKTSRLHAYRGRNAIERMFGRLKDFRRIATRYDRLACNYLAAVHIAAIVCYWL